jgi:lysyl-tRNA synthetase class 2
VGGLDRVFEINRNFRNEGISIQHNPEFTMLEYYWAYATYDDAMNFTEDMFLEISEDVVGSDQITYQGEKISFAKPWERITVKDAVKKYADFDQSALESVEGLKAAIQKRGLEVPEKGIAGGEPDYGDLLLYAFEELVESKLIQPTFVTEYPTSVSPLSRRNEQNPDVVDRFELFIYGREIANSFTELNDPDDQYGRFVTQAKAKLLGNDEACDVDMDYIRALEYGMPPAAGEGIGIDRLVMLFTDSASIRDVILFPQLKKETT